MGEKVLPFESQPSSDEVLRIVQTIDLQLENITAREHNTDVIDSPDDEFEQPYTTDLIVGNEWISIKRSYDGKKRRRWQITHRADANSPMTNIVLSAAYDQSYIGICPGTLTALSVYDAPTKLELSDVTEIVQKAKSISERPIPTPLNVLPFLRPPR